MPCTLIYFYYWPPLPLSDYILRADFFVTLLLAFTQRPITRDIHDV